MAQLLFVRSHAVIVKRHMLILVALLVVPSFCATLYVRESVAVDSALDSALHTITLLAERITPRIIPLFPFLIAIAHLSFLRARCLQPPLFTALSPYQGGCEVVRSNHWSVGHT